MTGKNIHDISQSKGRKPNNVQQRLQPSYELLHQCNSRTKQGSQWNLAITEATTCRNGRQKRRTKFPGIREMTSRKFHASLTPMFCYLFYFRDHTYSASLELVILSLVLDLSPPNSATCPSIWFPFIPPSLPLAVAFVNSVKFDFK